MTSTRLARSKEDIEAEIDILIERGRTLQEKIDAPKVRQAELDTLQKQRVNEIAQGMAQGRNADTSSIDGEIARAQKALQDATENAQAAQRGRELVYDEIHKLKVKLEAIARDERIAGIDGFAKRNASLHQKENEANARALQAQAEANEAAHARRRNAIDFLVGKAEQGIRAAEEFIPALDSVVESLAPVPRGDGVSTSTRIADPDKVATGELPPPVTINESGKRAPVTSDDLRDILRRIELPLKAAAPFAEVAAEALGEGWIKTEMLEMLRGIGSRVQAAIRKSGVEVSSDLFSGNYCWRGWVGEEHTAPVFQVLRDAGVVY